MDEYPVDHLHEPLMVSDLGFSEEALHREDWSDLEAGRPGPTPGAPTPGERVPETPEKGGPKAPEKRAPGAEERPPLERPPVPPTEVRGRGLLQGHWIRIETAVVEFEVVRGALEWSPEHAVLVFRDGRRREVEIDRSASTWTGPVEQGRLIRLALRIRPDEISGVELVEVRCGEETLRILL